MAVDQAAVPTLSSLTMTPLPTPAASSKPSSEQHSGLGIRSALPTASVWGPSHVVEIPRKDGESLGISIVGR